MISCYFSGEKSLGIGVFNNCNGVVDYALAAFCDIINEGTV
jgi:hypothetical protein